MAALRHSSQRSAAPILLAALLFLQGIRNNGAEEDYFEKCCELGDSWAGQKLRCEKFTGPVPGVPHDEQPVCIETVDICCRKAFQKLGCEQGKLDARAGRSCAPSSNGSKSLDGYSDHQRDCCEGCKLGILTGSSGKSCTGKKFSFGIPWDPAFMECCNEAVTSTTKDISSATPTTSTSSSTSSTSNTSPESEEFDDDLNETDDPTATTFKSDDLCQLMKGLLCSEICVPTPGSYYCMCNEGSILLDDGRSCKSNVTTTEAQPTTSSETSTFSTSTIMANSISDIITSFDLTSSPSADSRRANLTTATISLTSPNSSSSSTIKSSTRPISPLSTLKLLASGAKLRTTRSAATEDNELTSSCPPGYRLTSTDTCDDIDECAEEPAAVCTPGTGCRNTNGSYQCVAEPRQDNRNDDICETGYRWNSSLKWCLDIDECLENTHKCIVDTENCRNLEGSYECEIKCEKGYVFNSNYGACLDINECTELMNPCVQSDTICVNTLGSYECKTLREYNQFTEPSHIGNGSEDRRPGDYEGVVEGDIDECREYPQPCLPGEMCRNTVGGYDCVPTSCPRGFLYANDSCRDVDECEQGLHSCGPHERCQNTNGSFTCEQPRPTRRPTTAEPPKMYCRKGYKPDFERDTCVDVNECLEGPGCREYERCENLPGSYDCLALCGPGWRFDIRTKECRDVDECLLGHHNCRQRTHYCRNTNGSYECESLQSCPQGYRRAHNGSCGDVDECLEGLHRCAREHHRYCVNREGGYECITRLPSCPRGFEYSLLTRECDDVDECRAAERWPCDARLNERCVNLPGSYRCERPPPDLRKLRRPACRAGYGYEPALRRCSPLPDIDECADGTHNCGQQKCYNLPGSFHCAKAALPVVRRRPSTIDTAARTTPGSNCAVGSRYDTLRGGCIDIDECTELEDACSSNEQCWNTPGSFQCTCRTGFRRDELTQACVDVNECQLQNDCLPSQRCDNTLGSYTCVRFLPCGTGYTLNAATEICEDDDECVLETHDCSAGYHCRNTLGSFRCDRDRKGVTSTLRPTTRRTTRPTFRTTVTTYATPRTTINTTPASTTTTTTTTTPRPTDLPTTTSTTARPASTTTTTTTARPTTITTTTTTTESVPTVGTLATTTPYRRTTVVIRPRTNCPRGFESGPIGQCIDIDECHRNLKMCGNQRCVNTIGSFRCEPIRVLCGVGYAANPLTGVCTDIDECAEGRHKCGSEQQCENRQGGYICHCPPGYEADGKNGCRDIDECARALPGRACGSHSHCVNSPGSYLCVCEPGFENEPGTSGAGGCRDVDECRGTAGLCQHECYNTYGGHRCGCRFGFKLKPDNRSCEDIDECNEFRGNSLCVGICDNTPGSYVCRCPDGYKLSDDGRTCLDIDECAVGNAVGKAVCTSNGELCQNVRGGYRCNKINCPPGYIIDAQRKNRCVRESNLCPMNDAACFQRPAHYTFNYIAVISMYPIPASTGQVELFTMRGAYNLPGSTMRFSVAFIQARAPPHVVRATESCFALRRPFPSQAVLVMTRSLQGPQDIELEFSMEIYSPSGAFAGSAVAKIFIVVTQYEF